MATSIKDLATEIQERIILNVLRGRPIIITITTKRLPKYRDTAYRDREDFGFTSETSLAFASKQLEPVYYYVLRKYILRNPTDITVRAKVRNMDFTNLIKFFTALGASAPNVRVAVRHFIDKKFSAALNGYEKWIKYADDNGLQVTHEIWEAQEKNGDYFEFVDFKMGMWDFNYAEGQQKALLDAWNRFFVWEYQRLQPPQDEPRDPNDMDPRDAYWEGEDGEQAAAGAELDWEMSEFETDSEDEQEEEEQVQQPRGYIAGMAPDPEPYTDTEDEDEVEVEDEDSEMGDAEGENDENHAGQFDAEEDAMGGAEMDEEDIDDESDYDISEDEMDIDDMEVDPIMKLVEDAMARNKADD